MRAAAALAGAFACTWAHAQQSATIAWARLDDGCPAFLHAASEVVAFRDGDAEALDVGGVRVTRPGRLEVDGVALEFEAPFPFSPASWSFRVVAERCVAIASTAPARALAPETLGEFRERQVALRRAREALDAMQAAVAAQDRPRAVGSAESACHDRRAALGPRHPLVATCEIQLATRLLFAARYTEALERARSAYELLASVAPGRAGAEALSARNAQAQALFYLSRPQEMHEAAVEAYQGRLKLLGPAHPDTVLSQGTVAIALRRLGRLDEAIPVYEEVMRRQVAIHGPAGIDAIRAKSNLSAALQQRGDFDRVVTLQTEAFEALRASLGESHEFTLSATHDLAEALWDAGRASEALALAERSLPLFSARLGDEHAQTQRIKTLLGVIYLGLGREDEAVPLFAEVRAFRQRVLGDAHRGTALAARNLAEALLVQGRADEALGLLDGTLARMPGGAQRDVATERELQQLKAYALLRAGQPAKALAMFESALQARALQADEVRRATPDQLAESVGWAQAKLELGLHDSAIEALEAIHRGSVERFGPDHAITLDALATLASMNAAAGRGDRALELLATFVERNERRLEEGVLASPVNRGRLVQGVRERPHAAGYRTYVRLLASRDPARALEVAELTKARSLTEAIARPMQAAPSALRTAQIRFARAEERVASADIGTPPYMAAVAERSRAEEQLRRSLVPKARIPVAPSDIRETLRRTLPPATVLLHFVVSGDRVVAITASNAAQIKARDLGAVPGLADTVEALRRVLASRAPATERIWSLADGSFRWSLAQPPGSTRLAAPERIAHELSRRLLDPLVADLGSARNWVISPDGPLAALPFEALLLGRQPVLEARSVRYAPSLASLARMPAVVSTGSGRQFLGVGVSKFVERGWKDLPRAEAEVQAIGDLFPASQRMLLQGRSADEKSIRALDASGELRHFRFIHFATHAFLSTRGASLSGVVLSGGDASNDGVITAAEWPTYGLRSDLVVLSACDTGLGRPVAGEGVVGLPHALLSAGTRAVVLTLWGVPDASAAEFMPRFYKRLLSGKAAAEALRDTKLEFARSKGPWSAPLHWAAYVLYGAS